MPLSACSWPEKDRTRTGQRAERVHSGQRWYTVNVMQILVVTKILKIGFATILIN